MISITYVTHPFRQFPQPQHSPTPSLCSDNVVRAGLTPKLIDTPTLVAMLDYSCSPAEDRKFFPRANSQVPGCQEFQPPVPDFAVAR